MLAISCWPIGQCVNDTTSSKKVSENRDEIFVANMLLCRSHINLGLPFVIFQEATFSLLVVRINTFKKLNNTSGISLSIDF